MKLSRMWRLSLSTMLLGLLAMPFSSVSGENQSIPLVDQSQIMENLGANLYNQGLAQSFVATQSSLTRIDVKLDGSQSTLDYLEFKVFADNGAGAPDASSALAAGKLVPRQDCYFWDVYFRGWFIADFADIVVNPGSVYYIWVNIPDGSPNWSANWRAWDSSLDSNNIDYYPQGEAWCFVGILPTPSALPNEDSTFITYGGSDVGWSLPELLETGNSGDASQQDVAMDNSGCAVAVWSQFDGSRYGVWANRFDPETGWGVAEPIESDYSGNGAEPKIAMDGAGNAIAVWYSYHDLEYKVWSNWYVSGVGWGTAVNIDPSHTDAMVPEVACDHTGNATAAWIRTDMLRGIWASSYVAGVGWGSLEQIDAGVGWPQPPAIGMDDRGNAIAVWGQSNGTQYSIWANRCVKGEGWGTAEMIETNFTEDAWTPIVKVNGVGDAVVVWDQLLSGGTPHVWSNRYISDVGWQEPELLQEDKSVEAWNPRVAIDSDGNAVAVWYQVQDSGETHVWTNRYETATGWTGAQRLDAALIWAVPCEVAMDSVGDAMAVWYEYNGSYSIVACEYTRDLGWMTPERIWSGSSQVNDPKVGAGLLGNAVVIWSGFDGQNQSIYGANFQPPLIRLTEPLDGAIFDVPVARVAGVALPGIRVEANGLLLAVADNGSFSAYIPLLEGQNLIEFTGTDLAGNSQTLSVTVTYVNPIHQLEDEISMVRDSLNRSRNDSAALRADLNETRDELAGVSDELDDSRTTTLLVGCLAGALAVSFAVTMIAYLSLRKKLRRTDEPSSGLKPQA